MIIKFYIFHLVSLVSNNNINVTVFDYDDLINNNVQKNSRNIIELDEEYHNSFSEVAKGEVYSEDEEKSSRTYYNYDIPDRRFGGLVADDRYNTYYGGNQSWFKESSKRNAGCGTVAVANIMAYYDKFLGYGKLYTPYNNSTSDFLTHMYEVERYVPANNLIGIPLKRDLAIYMERYMKSKGYSGYTNFKDFSSSYSSDKLTLRNVMSNNKPVAFLQIYNDYYDDFDYHWMTITKYFENSTTSYIALSTWNRRVSYDFKMYHNNMTNSSKYGFGGIVYINRIY